MDDPQNDAIDHARNKTMPPHDAKCVHIGKQGDLSKLPQAIQSQTDGEQHHQKF